MTVGIAYAEQPRQVRILMTEKEEGVLISDIVWIKETLKTHVNDADQKNIGTYKKMTWLNFTAIIGLGIKSLFMPS